MICSLKLFLIFVFYRCAYTACSEDIASLVSPSSTEVPSECEFISINISSKSSGSGFEYKKVKISEKDTHVWTPSGDNRITSIYDDHKLVWQADDNSYCKSVHFRNPLLSNHTLTAKLVIDGDDHEKTFDKEGGYFYERSTVFVNISKSDGTDYTFEDNVRDKTGDQIYTVKDGKRITLVISKGFCSKSLLFWKAVGKWYCTKVILTKQSDNLVKISLDITNGSTNTTLVLVKQDDKNWVPENTVFVDLKKKGNVPNCDYKPSITDKSGSFTYEPKQGFKIIGIGHESLSDLDKLVWRSHGSQFCTKVTGTVEKDKTTRILVDLSDQTGAETKRLFVSHDSKWIEGAVNPEL